MSFYRLNDCRLELNENGKITEIVFPEKVYGVPTLNNSRRYVAVASVNKIFVYDFEIETIITLLHKSKHHITGVRFDKKDNLYYIDGNNIGVIDIITSNDTILYNVGKKQHNPQNIGVSPNGTYVSFCRYRGDNLCLYLYDMQKEEFKDYKLSIYHYAWLDDDHIVWSKGGGLKVLDVNTGKSQLIVKDHKSLIKKISKENIEMFDVFKGIDNTSLFVDLELLRVLNGNIYFSLAINYFGNDVPEDAKQHYGIWSINFEENTVKFHYEFSSEYRKANAGWKFLMNDGNLAWARNGWHIFDGISNKTLSGEWEQIIYFDSLNK